VVVFEQRLEGMAVQESRTPKRGSRTFPEGIPAAHVKELYLSIDYAPVQFRTRNVRVWLPQTVDAYGDFGDHRTIIYHTFANFLLFSVQTDQVIDTPKNAE
jgi:hypothetical protein